MGEWGVGEGVCLWLGEVVWIEREEYGVGGGYVMLWHECYCKTFVLFFS